jgi:MOSC domain-containing protein YiiM
MKILSVNVATVGDLFITQSGEKHRIKTGIHKLSVAGAQQVHRLGIAGDEQADQSVHGGLDKAVYAYPSEHYDFWLAQRATSLKRPVAELTLAPGALGENLTTQGILETDVWIGDRLHIGSTVLQVTEPRHPCFKLNGKLGFSHAAKLMIQSGFSGFYLRVVETGVLQAGDAITVTPGPREVSLVWLNERRRKGRQEDLF